MTTSLRLALVLCMWATALGSIGCSRTDRPELGRVQGTVTLDGKPLSGAIIQFSPEAGRAAVAQTGADGSYDLIYVHGVKGAEVGPNTVSFTWPDGERGSARIPDKYVANSQLKVDVQPGKNTFDFALESD